MDDWRPPPTVSLHDHGRVRVRTATVADADEVARIYVESWNGGFGALMPPQVLDDDRTRRWAEAITNGPAIWWVAERHRAVVGFVGVGPSRDPVDPALGELDTIAVDPPDWRTGVGRVLMATAVEGLSRLGYRTAILWTLAGYDRGIRFYESTGWTADGGSRHDGTQISFRRTIEPSDPPQA